MTKFRFASIAAFILLASAAVLPAGWVKHRTKTLSWLRDVTFVDDKKGFIVGAGGTVLETRDGGSTWTVRPGITDDTVVQVIFTDRANGWLLCERDVFSRGQSALSYLMRTSDGGETWDRIEFAGRERLSRVFFNASGDGFAVGENGTVFSYRAASGGWERQILQTRYRFLDGVFTGDKTAVLAGGGASLLYTDDAGVTWKRGTVPGAAEVRFNAVCFWNQKSGWAVGAGGMIAQTVNGGRSWRLQNSGIKADLYDVVFTNSATGFAVGADGRILTTSTAGNVWTAEPSGVAHRLERVAVNGKRAVAVGFGGTILTSER
jgi:photosystem II stability/assembly factor-like uncharacterized protein